MRVGCDVQLAALVIHPRDSSVQLQTETHPERGPNAAQLLTRSRRTSATSLRTARLVGTRLVCVDFSGLGLQALGARAAFEGEFSPQDETPRSEGEKRTEEGEEEAGRQLSARHDLLP